MGNFQGGDKRGGGGGYRGGSGGGRPSFQKKDFRGGNRGGERSEMHKAVCSECSKSCEVPFRPSSDKPVYCSDCFSSKRDDGDRGQRKDFGNGPKRDFNRAPMSRPDMARPAQGNNDDVKKHLGDISIKLDRLINSMEKLISSKTDTAFVKNSPKIAEKTEIKKAPNLKVVLKKAVATKTPAKKVATKKIVVKKKK